VTNLLYQYDPKYIMDEDYKPTCAGGCGSIWSEDWFELWCPHCYSGIMEAYLRPAQLYESPEPKVPDKPLRKMPIITIVCLVFTNIFMCLFI
jgi:hypothetical protein